MLQYYFCGLSYDNNIPYDMVIIEKFNNNTYIEGSKKYFILDMKEVVLCQFSTLKKRLKSIYNIGIMKNSK